MPEFCVVPGHFFNQTGNIASKKTASIYLDEKPQHCSQSPAAMADTDVRPVRVWAANLVNSAVYPKFTVICYVRKQLQVGAQTIVED